MSLRRLARDYWELALLAVGLAGLFLFCGCVTITHRVVFPQLPDRPTTQPAASQPTTDYYGAWRRARGV